MILLGIAISGLILNLQDSAKAITDQVKVEVSDMIEKKGK